MTCTARVLLAMATACCPACLSVAQEEGGYFGGRGRFPSQRAAQSVQSASPFAPPATSFDTWDVLMIDGRRVGYRHTSHNVGEMRGGTEWSTTALERMRLSRAGQPMDVMIHTTTGWDRDRTIASFSYEQRDGPPDQLRTSQQNSGKVRDRRITWGVTLPDDTRPEVWPEGAGGYFAVEQALRRSPLQPGEKREITNLMPLIDAFAVTHLTAPRWEPVELLDRTAHLLRVESVTQLPGGVRLASTLWCDEEGEILKSEVPAMKLVAVRAERETALLSNEHSADLFATLLVKVDPPPQHAHQRGTITYEVRTVVGDVLRAFQSSYRQRLAPVDASRARLTATATWDGYWSKQQLAASPPREQNAYLVARGLVDHNDAQVRELAHSVGSQQDDPWQLAMLLEELVHETIAEKNLETTMAPASEVARSRAGDCTEHAVLLAALCRARGIPAGVAIGLVYVPQSGGFLYHMWNEVWVHNTWRPLDATFARGGIGAAHLKISGSALDEPGGYPSVLPVLNVVGQIELKVIEEE